MTSAANENMAISTRMSWRYFFPIVVVYLLLLTVFFYDTVESMVSIWSRSETFTHAFLILPISIWLVWEKRANLKVMSPEPSWQGMTVLFAVGFLWLFGYLVDALVVQQLAWVAAFVAGVWAILGNRTTWVIAFPLAFLIFMVPFGEDLVPGMMEFTADFTIGLIRLTGIPVYREGLFFTLPSGNWSVVEACSGIRYLIASVTLGCLYSYLTYTSAKKRFIFIIVSIVVPIIANGLRAYIIVMLGHVSDMTIATGVDHLVYGWVFFGIVIFIMITIGARFRDEVDSTVHIEPSIFASTKQYGFRKALPLAVLTICLIGVWPALAYVIDQSEDSSGQSTEMLPLAGVTNWSSSDQAAWAWQPSNRGIEKVEQFFEKDGYKVAVYLQYLFQKRDNVELINSQNTLLDPEQSEWRIVGNDRRQLILAARTIEVKETLLKSGDKQLLIWSWYRIGERYTSNKYVAKLLEGFNRLTFGRQDEGEIIVAMEFDENTDSADQVDVLQSFVKDLLPNVEKSVDSKVASSQ
ncbi:exosortase A [Neptunomonas japonica]|uniref:exosortase A n=1 Tax=Neptunomonas japonica TaxID=417574 RepID=UPI000410FC87|nr:exosortase A [Neptunomonas japonica]